LLAYPATDCRFDLPSYEENSEGYVMSTEEVRWLWEQYLTGPADAEHPYVSPLRAASHVGLPPALIITAEYDPVRDDGYAYAEKLRAAGVPVQHVNYEGMIHIHWMIPGHPSARLARMDAGEAVREALSTKP
jgi:acetyl esterase